MLEIESSLSIFAWFQIYANMEAVCSEHGRRNDTLTFNFLDYLFYLSHYLTKGRKMLAIKKNGIILTYFK